MDNRFDLIVVGGGLSGCGAAIAAARSGLKVLLIEESNALGGAAATCLVNPFMPYFTQRDGQLVRLSRGIFEEIANALCETENQINGTTYDNAKRPIQIFNDEYLKIILSRMALKAGVDILFHAVVTGSTVTPDKSVTSVTVSCCGRVLEFYADSFIDATGDADLCVMSGFETVVGRPEDGLCQPMTLCFRVGCIDTDSFYKALPDVQNLYRREQSEGRISNPRENILVFRTTAPDVLHFNTTRVVGLNPTDPYDVTLAELKAREQVFEMFSFLKKNSPGFERAVLLSTAMSIGVRESRMVVGEYTLTQSDLTSFKKFDDGIAACNYDIDIHNPSGSGTSHWYFPAGEYYTVPYRCLIPKGSKNLLVAGRCISCTHEAQASLRIMPVVCNTGEAAGYAAAIALKHNVGVSDIPTHELTSLIRENGGFIG